MPDATLLRGAVFTGLACALPAVCWAVGTAALAGANGGVPALADGVDGLWLAQGVAVATLTPACVMVRPARDVAVAALVFILFPLPLLALAWLAGVHPASTLAMSALFLVAMALAALTASVMLRRMLPGAGVSGAAVLMLQTALGFATLVYKDTWLGWIGA